MNIKAVFICYKNLWFKALGLILVALGIIGIVLPVMPTTIFFILALTCFTRSSPALEQWLLNHPRYGVILKQWQAHKVVPVKAKCYAAIGMLIGFIFLLYSAAPIWVICLVAVVEVSVIIYLILRPSSPPKH
ncbi:YbaN family protein [Pseudoalteromonas distincta]|uniref:YbaN family protein n=1 Tax=Pseudoalteromonas distincta TaxID=77608 RepID=UPI0032185F4E